MIPDNILRRHILQALGEIAKLGFPRNRRPTRYWLLYDGRRYPPKYVLSVANRNANGSELKSDQFSGGRESNSFLETLGFEIVGLGAKGQAKPPRPRERKHRGRIRRHGKRCPVCKVRVKELLRAAYGEVRTGFSLKVGSRPEDFRATAAYRPLKAIFQALGSFRNQPDFVKVPRLPHVDYFIPTERRVIEFDERQHFTEPRRLSLRLYPDQLELGLTDTGGSASVRA